MPSLQIKHQPDTYVDPKQVLRAHVDQLPVEKQREFAKSALQLIAERTGMNEADMMKKPRWLS